MKSRTSSRAGRSATPALRCSKRRWARCRDTTSSRPTAANAFWCRFPCFHCRFPTWSTDVRIRDRRCSGLLRFAAASARESRLRRKRGTGSGSSAIWSIAVRRHSPHCVSSKTSATVRSRCWVIMTYIFWRRLPDNAHRNRAIRWHKSSKRPIVTRCSTGFAADLCSTSTNSWGLQWCMRVFPTSGTSTLRWNAHVKWSRCWPATTVARCLQRCMATTPRAGAMGSKEWNGLRSIINYLTRMRLIDAVGVLELTYDGGLEGMPRGYDAWFDFYRAKPSAFPSSSATGRRSTANATSKTCTRLDTGCVWGNRLTALRLDDRERFSVNSVE